MGSVSPGRRHALAILRRVEEGARASPLLQALGREGLDARDAAFVTELVNGTLRRRFYLDHVIAAFSARPVAGVDADLKSVLRLALYQILFMDRVPAHAAVDEAVSMARRLPGRRGGGAASFVNALLRSVTSARGRVPPPPRPAPGEDPARALAIAASHPEWLVGRWLARFGVEEGARLLEAQNRPGPVALRVNRRRADPAEVAARLAAEGIDTRPGRFLPEFLIVEEGAPQRTRAFRDGLFYIQDESSGLVARLTASALPARAWLALDACAGRGGKTLALAEGAGSSGLVVGADLHPARLRLLRENGRRLRLAGWSALAADMASERGPFRAGTAFDAVLADAPCTGTGVIRRHPELRYRIGPEDLRRMAELQARLLDRCAGLVRPAGRLVYSVCSLEPEEGPAQVRRFLERAPGFVLDDPRPDLPEAARGLATAAPDGPWLTTLPHRDDLDGFFAARLRRQR